MKHLNELIAVTAWIFGLAVTPGWWKVLALFPPYAWYELASHVIEKL